MRHIEQLRPYLDLGFNHLVFHSPGDGPGALPRAVRLRTSCRGFASYGDENLGRRPDQRLRFGQSSGCGRRSATKSRRSLARQNARLAVRAASAGDHVLVVAGSEEVSEMAAAWGADVLLEPREEGQNAAAERGSNVPWKEAPGQCFFFPATCRS